jgi:predicted protein tyrosine phosphatase
VSNREDQPNLKTKKEKYMNTNYYPVEIWNEVAPGFYQGGSDDSDTMGAYLREAPSRYEINRMFGQISIGQVTKKHFDTVVTLYSAANAVSHNVKELRFAFHDGDMSDLDPERDLFFMVREAHSDWKAGKKVLIRCQAGINRSGLVTALVLIREGHSPADAVRLIRDNRCEAALSNSRFEEYLLNVADVAFWRKS